MTLANNSPQTVESSMLPIRPVANNIAKRYVNNRAMSFITVFGDDGQKSTERLDQLKAKRRVQLQLQRQLLKSRWRLLQNKDYAQLDTFHRAIRPIMFFAQIFGVMPVMNMLSMNPQHLQFHCQSIVMLNSIIFLIFGTLTTLSYTASMLTTGINGKNMVGLVFVYMTMSIFVCFLSLARRWPQLLRYWTRIELIFLLPPYSNICMNNNKSKCNNHCDNLLQRKLRVLAITLGVMAMVEHSLFYATEYNNFYMKVQHCSANQTQATFRAFTRKRFNELFKYLPYNGIAIFYAIFLNSSFTFIWNYLDIFIMLVSLALATRFQQLAAYVELLKGRYVPDALWYAIRRDHIELCELLELVNEHLANFVLISCLNNTYFISYQLLNIFTKLRWPLSYAYFWVSLAFLLLRTCSVFLCAAQIHEASLLPLKTLYLLPSGCWTVEVQRFIAQITQESIGLSGSGFYLVTRQNLFGLMAAIVAYELMLLQFDAENWGKSLPALCGDE